MTRQELVDAFINAYGEDNQAALHYAYDLIVGYNLDFTKERGEK